MLTSRLIRSRAALAALPVALISLAGCNLAFTTGIEARDTWNRTYKVKAGAEVELREVSGRIHVEAGDGDEVIVNATRVVKASTEEAAKAALADYRISESATPEHVTIDSSNAEGGLQLRMSRHVDYDVKMPRNGQLTIKTTNGEITVSAVAGLVRIETVNGDIEVTGLEKGADVNAVNGRVQLTAATVGEGGIRCKTTNGQIIVTLPSSAKATIAARATNGIVHTENLTVQTSESSHNRLDGTIGGGGPMIRLDTTNGEVNIRGRD